ncbi:MAG: flavodoxin family protein [Sedimentisphaerales bacterium]|nr:flavodoxin family protein [Sedimentisphaerales bacterium]
MKVIAISGSPRPNGNTERACEFTFEPLRQAGIETELISLAGKNIGPCTACGGCSNQPRCTAHNDDFPAIMQKVLSADGLILASPVYFNCATGPICNFIHRLGYVARKNGHLLSRRVGSAIAVGRRAGLNATFAQLSMFFAANDMIQVGSTYWNVVLAREPGQIDQDKEGIQTLTRFGENLAWLMRKILSCEN